MGKKSRFVEVRIAFPLWFGDRHLQPGETATVPAELADEWIQSMRATAVVAEDKTWQPEEQ
jgi:hypothetical protein